jgi:hypothetical protein
VVILSTDLGEASPGLSVGGEVSGLGDGDVGGVSQVDGLGHGGDGGGGVCGGDGSGRDGQVGGGDAESVDGVGDVVDGLEEAVGVDVRVSTTGHTIIGLDLVLGRRAAGVAVRELSQLILSVVLVAAGGGSVGDAGVGDATVQEHLGLGGGHGHGEDHLRISPKCLGFAIDA